MALVTEGGGGWLLSMMPDGASDKVVQVMVSRHVVCFERSLLQILENKGVMGACQRLSKQTGSSIGGEEGLLPMC